MIAETDSPRSISDLHRSRETKQPPRRKSTFRSQRLSLRNGERKLAQSHDC